MTTAKIEIPVPDLGKSVSARLFVPDLPDDAGTGAGLPAYLHLPGTDFSDGYVPEEDDPLCEKLCRKLNCAIFMPLWESGKSAGFPAVHEQCYASAVWIFAHAKEYGIDPDRISVGGSGAGANLAAGLVLRAKATGEWTPRCWVLAAPPLDLREQYQKQNSAEHRYIGENSQYTRSPYVSPVFASDTMLTELPPVLLLLSDSDEEAERGAAFAGRMAANGTEVSAERLIRHNAAQKGYRNFRKAAEKPVLDFLLMQNSRLPEQTEFRDGAAGMAAIEG